VANVYVSENIHRKFAIPVASPTDRITKHLVLCKAHLFLYQTAETASKSTHNWWRYPSSKCYEIDENFRFGIWRSAVAPSDSGEKNGNMGAQLQSFRCTKAPKILWKIYFLYDFWGAKTCSFQTIFGLPVRNL